MKIKDRLMKLESRSLHAKSAPRIIFIIPRHATYKQHNGWKYTDAEGIDRQVFREIDEDDDALRKRAQAIAGKDRGKDKIEILFMEYI